MHGISTLVGYLMPNPVYTYIRDIYELNELFLVNIIFKQVKAPLFAHIWMVSRLLLSNTNSIIITQSNGSKTCSVIIQFNIDNLFVHVLMVSSLENDNVFLFDP